jgi:hypothetical protein
MLLKILLALVTFLYFQEIYGILLSDKYIMYIM